MKVIEKGSGQKGWAKEYKCTGDGNGGNGCKAILLVEEDDLFRTESHHYDGSSESYTTFRCPECGTQTDIPSVDYRGPLPSRNAWVARNGFVLREGRILGKHE